MADEDSKYDVKRMKEKEEMVRGKGNTTQNL